MEGSSKRSAGAASGLPEGPLVDILSRLPAKSVCRFKCVSKGWSELIADPAIRKKLRQAMQGLLVQTAVFENREFTGRVNFSLINMAGRSVPFSFSFLTEMTGIRAFFFLDSCNGLVLLGHRRERNHASAGDYFVCNPATKEWLGVPACGSRDMLSHTYLAFDPAVSSHFHLVQFQMPDADWEVESLHVYSSETGTWSQNQLGGQNEEDQINEQNEQGPFFLWGIGQGQLEGQIDEQNEQGQLEGQIDEQIEQWQLEGQIVQIVEQNEQGQLEGQIDEQIEQWQLEGQIAQIVEQNEQGQLEDQIDEQNEQWQLEGQIVEQNEQGQLEGQIVEQNEQGQLEGWHDHFKLEVLDYHCAFVNGLLHLIVWGPDRQRILIIDIQGKARRIITVPGMGDGSQRAHYLGQSQGHLHCVTLETAVEINDNISLWVLQDYDTQEWVLKSTVNSLDVFGETEEMPEYSVVDIHQDCNVLFFYHQLTNELIAYDMDRKEASVLATFQDPKCRGDFARYFPYFLETPALKNKH